MARRKAASRWEHLDFLVNGEGDVTLGRVGPIRCVAAASDRHNALAMLVRRRGESLEELLTRLDEAVRLAVEEDVFSDEVNE
jgi:hypothetical protein